MSNHPVEICLIQYPQANRRTRYQIPTQTATAPHSHEKALPDEAASVSRLGMTYIHMPVDFQNPTDQDFDQFCAAVKKLMDVPVHVHCIANYRVSAFFYRYRRDVLGIEEARARVDMEEVWHLTNAARRLVLLTAFLTARFTIVPRGTDSS